MGDPVSSNWICNVVELPFLDKTFFFGEFSQGFTIMDIGQDYIWPQMIICNKSFPKITEILQSLY